MGGELPGMLLSLLIILKVLSSTEAYRSCLLTGPSSSRHASCISRRLSSVPQDLPANIVGLHLGYNRITTFSQSDFSRYGSLRELDLRSNDIATFNSQAFYGLPNLIELDLSYNHVLSNLTADMFTGLGNIEELNLDGNDISDIPTGTFSSTPQLRTLSLSNNKLTNLRSDMFTGLGNLHKLWMDNNEISDIQAGTFSSTPQLRTLSLDNNKLKNPKSDMFTGPENLEKLYLDDNEISDIQAGTFRSTPQLGTLSLRDNKLKNPKSDMFTGPENLESLYLDNNNISDIPTGTFSSTPQLRTLTLHNNKLKETKSDMFTGPENLETLYLDDNEISDIQAGTFRSTPQLRTLSLINNKLTKLRSDMFTGLGNLWELWLGRYDMFPWHGLQPDTNEISDIQAGTFNSTPQLGTLSLSHNKLTNLKSDMFTGLGNLQYLYLDNNEINDIQVGTFSTSTPQLRNLYLSNNKLTNLRSDMFTGLGNLHKLWMDNNEISDIQAGTFSSTPQLRTLYLQQNRLTVLKAEIFAKLSSLWSVTFYNNPWQCDCRMVPFRQKMNGSYSFENQIICEGPSNFRWQQLIDISPEDLICEEPTIVKFEGAHNNTVLEGEMLHLVCEVSGIPTPDITVILPSGLTATVESDGRVNVKVNGAITITNITVADAGLYICIAASPIGSMFAILVVDVHLKESTTSTVAPVTSPPYIVRFDRIDYTCSPLVQGLTLYLVCEASGIPTTDITVILPSGLIATFESDGRLTVKFNGTMTITNVTAADSGQYISIAVSFVDSTSAILQLVVNIQLKLTTTSTVAPVTLPLTTTSTLNRTKSSSSYHESTPGSGGTYSIPILSAPSKQSQPAPNFSLPVLIGSVCGSVVSTVLVVIIILTIWHKRKTQNTPSHSTPPVVYSNASAKVTIDGHDQTRQGGDQTTSTILKNASSSEHAEIEYADIALSPSKTQNSPSPSTPPVVYSNASAKVTISGHDQTGQGGVQATSKTLKNARSPEHVEVEYADIALSPSNTETNVARQPQQPAEYQSLGTNRNRAPSDELPPLPPPSNRNNGGETGALRYYQSLKKKT